MCYLRYATLSLLLRAVVVVASNWVDTQVSAPASVEPATMSLQLHVVAGVDPSLADMRGSPPTSAQLEPIPPGTSAVRSTGTVAADMSCSLPFLTCFGFPCQTHYSYEHLLVLGVERLAPTTYKNEVLG